MEYMNYNNKLQVIKINYLNNLLVEINKLYTNGYFELNKDTLKTQYIIDLDKFNKLKFSLDILIGEEFKACIGDVKVELSLDNKFYHPLYHSNLKSFMCTCSSFKDHHKTSELLKWNQPLLYPKDINSFVNLLNDFIGFTKNNTRYILNNLLINELRKSLPIIKLNEHCVTFKGKEYIYVHFKEDDIYIVDRRVNNRIKVESLTELSNFLIYLDIYNSTLTMDICLLNKIFNLLNIRDNSKTNLYNVMNLIIPDNNGSLILNKNTNYNMVFSKEEISLVIQSNTLENKQINHIFNINEYSTLNGLYEDVYNQLYKYRLLGII